MSSTAHFIILGINSCRKSTIIRHTRPKKIKNRFSKKYGFIKFIDFMVTTQGSRLRVTRLL
jgi:hypothetical protein